MSRGGGPPTLVIWGPEGRMGEVITISVVDDDESIRRALRRLIRSTGLGVDTFGSAEEFLERGDRATRCLILDVKLPGISGLDLQGRLAATDPMIPIIFVSAYGSQEMKDRAMKAGAIDFLGKPFSEETLLDDVRLALDARR
jgi:FixJ family two-component response regulator